MAHDHGLPLMVDSTFSTPYLIRPIDYGADIVMHSVTKFLGGHGVALGGVIVDGGRFDWAAAGKHPTLTEPYAGYHGLSFAEEFGPAALGMRARAEGLRDFGGAMSPANAFQLIQGVETLPLRMARHVSNTEAVVAMLEANDAVGWVRHPSVTSHPDHELANQLYPKGDRRDTQLRGEGRARRRTEVHRVGPAGIAPGQRWRREDPRHPPGIDHPPAAQRRGHGGRRNR